MSKHYICVWHHMLHFNLYDVVLVSKAMGVKPDTHVSLHVLPYIWNLQMFLLLICIVDLQPLLVISTTNKIYYRITQSLEVARLLFKTVLITSIFFVTLIIHSNYVGWTAKEILCLSSFYGYVYESIAFNSFPPGQNGRLFPDDIFRCILMNEKFCILLKFHWSLFLRIQLTITQRWFR